MISASAEDVCTIISVMPIRLTEDKPLFPSHYEIPPCLNVATGAETLIVRRGSFKVYIDESRPALVIPEPADTIASAICRDFKVSISNFTAGHAEPGLFWARNGYTPEEALADKALKEEFTRTRLLQENWFKSLVATADDDWARYRMRKMISDVQRLAAKSLGVQRAWDIDFEVSSTIKMTNCKFCRAEVHPDAVICMHCRGILDMVRYKNDFVSPETLRQEAR